MKRCPLTLPLMLALALAAPAGATNLEEDPVTVTNAETDHAALLELSRSKWQWMADQDLERLEPLFHEQARFVHMSRTMNRAEELEVIRSGGIHYKHAEIRDMSAEVVGDVAVVYSRIRLTAVVGGNEVVNPFSVTETYLRDGDGWVLGAMAFSRLVGE